MPLISPDGREIDPCSLAQHLVNLSHRQVKALGLATSGIYGPRGCISSASASLSTSMASKLQARFGTDGSILFLTTFKTQVTPAQRQIFRLAASARRTCANEFGLLGIWPTPLVQDSGNGNQLRGMRADGRDRGPGLCDVATLASWATPTVRDWKDGAKQDVPINSLLGRQVWGAPWATPKTRATGNPSRAMNHRMRLEDQVFAAPWATPTVTDASRGILPPRPQDSGIPLTQQIGMLSNGSFASMKNNGQLNPDFPRWLMGYPESWARCSPNFWQWELTQKMQSDSQGLPQGFFAALAHFVLNKYGATVTR